jgi:hypothetical protein
MQVCNVVCCVVVLYVLLACSSYIYVVLFYYSSIMNSLVYVYLVQERSGQDDSIGGILR